MKKTILEKTIDFVEKQNQQIRHHETIQKQMKKQIKLQIMTTRQTGGLYQGYKPKLPASA